MRVAVFEPLPRTCGVTAWAFHHAQGWRDLGHHCDVVTFTTSGRKRTTRAKVDEGPRRGWRWWATEPDVTGKWVDAPDVLNSYDLIVMNEPKNAPLDFDATKEKRLPEYVTALSNVRTPWVTALHDSMAYTTQLAPFLAETIATPSFSGLAIECRPGSYTSGEWALAGYVKRLQPWPWLPYVPRGRAPDVARQRVIALGGRFTTTKGFQTLAEVAIDLDPAYEVRIFGPEAGGMGPSISFRIYEAMARHAGWVGERIDPKKAGEEHHSAKDLEINNIASVNAGYPWTLHKNGHTMKYTGPYLDAIAAWTECALAVQLSTDSIVTTFEYTTLEALDAGCSLILPRYYARDMGDVNYDVRYLEHFTRGASLGAKGIRWDDGRARRELLDKIDFAIGELEAGNHDPEINWQAIARYHAPRHLAAKIEEIL